MQMEHQEPCKVPQETAYFWRSKISLEELDLIFLKVWQTMGFKLLIRLFWKDHISSISIAILLLNQESHKAHWSLNA